MKRKMMLVIVIAIALAIATDHLYIHRTNKVYPVPQEKSTVRTPDVITDPMVLPGNVLLYFLD